MNETFKVIIIAVLSGGIGAGVLKLIGDRLAWKRERKAKKEDRAEQNTEEIIQNLKADVMELKIVLEALKEAQKYISYDRIRFLALSYIKEGEIDFDDRRILKDMHKSYHYGLNGNGDLDNLMKKIDDLPLKLK